MDAETTDARPPSAGEAPCDDPAVLVLAAVMYLVLGSVATMSAVVALGLVRRLFTRDHRLVRLPRPADGYARHGWRTSASS